MIPEIIVHYSNVEVDQDVSECLLHEKPKQGLTQSFVHSATIADAAYLVLWYGPLSPHCAHCSAVFMMGKHFSG